MFSLTHLFGTMLAEADGDIKPSQDTLKQALQTDEKNPALLDLNQYGLVPNNVTTFFVNPSATKDLEELPDWFVQFALAQSKQNSSGNDENYNIVTNYLMKKFPGYTSDPENTVGKHMLVCEVKQAGRCPDGYQKVYLDNFRLRTDDELKSLLSQKNKDKVEKKQNKKPQPPVDANTDADATVPEE